MNLLLSNLEARPPSLTHLLLGFNLNAPIEESNLEETRYLSCLQVIVDLLASPDVSQQHPLLCEMMYEFIYRACADRLTAIPMMNYLRHKGI